MKKCKIIGYGKFEDKDSKKEMLRIVIGIPSNSENYTGTMVTIAFLEYSDKLCNNLDKAINENLEMYYQTSDNIITGKTKITELELNYAYENNNF